MLTYVCSTCGTSYPPSERAPDRCAICDEERQWVPTTGQAWTSPTQLERKHVNAWRMHEPGLLSVHTIPAFAIGQRAFLVKTPAGNILWDCIALIDDATRELINGLGGLSGIAISHPHYYTRMQDWSEAFGGVPIHLHAADREWIVRPSPRIRLWDGEVLEIAPGATLLRLGGHFPGGTVLHWAGSASGSGVLLSGDIVQVAADTRRVSFLWSYPNMMPLPAREVAHIGQVLEQWDFEKIHGAFDGKTVTGDAKAVVARSVERYLELLRS